MRSGCHLSGILQMNAGSSQAYDILGFPANTQEVAEVVKRVREAEVERSWRQMSGMKGASI
jgi:hypothetical protein